MSVLIHCCPVNRPGRRDHRLEVFALPGEAFEVVEVVVILGCRRRSILELLDWEAIAELALLAEVDYQRIHGMGEAA